MVVIERLTYGGKGVTYGGNREVQLQEVKGLERLTCNIWW